MARWHWPAELGGPRTTEQVREILRGFATEMAIAGLAWGFGDRGIERIVAFTVPQNLGSQRVMCRAGMTYERDFTRKGHPHVLYLAESKSWHPPS